ncbi:50S ribosomal protein L29 [archaeon]|nr:MAG: 50S ribosomal protein L29 [archaeon]
MVKVKVSELRGKNKGDLLTQLGELKKELSQLRVTQVTNNNASKVAKIKVVRKDIARVLTVVNQKAKSAMRKEAKDNKYKHVPKALRAKKTRALRRALTPAQAALQTVRAAKKAANFPLRKFALKA